MKRRTLAAALLLGGLSAGSCLVYDEDDLPDIEAAGGSTGRGGAGMAGGLPSGGTSGGASGGTSGGSLGGGSDAAGEGGGGTPDAMGGEGGDTDDGQAGAPPSGGSGGTGAVSGSSGAGTGGTLGGGGSGVGGIPGAGGTITWAPELIDDCEDFDNQLLSHETRNGYWYTLGDGTAKATLSPVAGALQWMTALLPAEQSAMNKAALQVRMAGFNRPHPEGWGAGAGLNFRAPEAVYDGSEYAGISFVAKASAAMLPVQVKIGLKGTVVSSGECAETPTTPSSQLCGNHPVKPLMLSTGWARYDLKWSDFMQDASWGKQVVFRSADLVTLQFIVPPPGSNNASLWIDEVKFLLATPAPSAPAEAP